jgi:hypothetical protein
MVTLVAVSWNPMLPLTGVPETVAEATTVSAPTVVLLAGDSVTVATPSPLVSAVGALNAPSELLELNETTTLGTPAPVPVSTRAVTVAGLAAVTVVGAATALAQAYGVSSDLISMSRAPGGT